MSLINDALKKAQAGHAQGNTQGTNPAVPATTSPVAPEAKHGHSPSIWTLFTLFLTIAVAFGGGAALIVWGLLKAEEQDETLALQEQQPDRIVAPTTDRLLATTTDESLPTPLDSSTTPADPLPQAATTPLPEPTPVTAAVQPETTTLAISVESPPIPAEPSTPPPPPNPQVVEYLDRVEVRGIMSGGRKVLLYFVDTQRSQAFDVGSTISNELQVRISATHDNPRRIIFEDHVGASYVKYF